MEKTAKNLLAKRTVRNLKGKLLGYSFTPHELQAFIDQLCREQRGLDAKKYWALEETANRITKHAIINNKQPEI
jgi:hypothetical protein